MTHLLRCLNPLTELDLPVPGISAHARRQKSILHGHVSRLQIWWARRFLAACSGAICAPLWPYPEDTNITVDVRFIEVKGRAGIDEVLLA